MKTNESTNACPKCGAPVPPEAPQGLCPQCVFVQAAAPEGAPTATSQIPSLERLAVAFPQLQVLELIGRGGMGFVFKARQPNLDRFVALKLLPDSLAHDAHFAERFNREGRTLARLNHPNIVSIFDFGHTSSRTGVSPVQPISESDGRTGGTPVLREGGFYFLLMEYVDGVNLRQAMQAGKFSPSEALSIVPKICEALQFAHEEGILHRDIKPENILLDAKGRVKIADFGIAKIVGEDKPDVSLTATGAALGTPHYMAPEQFEKPATVDHRADIYSLGVVFYEMLTGELPIGRFSPPSQRTPLDPRVDDVVMRTLEKEREKRFQSAGEMQTNVEHLTDAGAGKFSAPPPKTSGVGERAPGGTVVIKPKDVLNMPKWSLKAVWGAGLVGISFVVVLLSFVAYFAATRRNFVSTQALVLMGGSLLFSLPAIAGTILGWMGLSDVSRGEKRGAAFAIFAALFWPVILLAAFTVWLVIAPIRNFAEMAPFASLLLLLVPAGTVTFIIWAIYTTVQKATGQPTLQRRGMLKWVFAALLVSGIGFVFVKRAARTSPQDTTRAVAVADTNATPWIRFTFTAVELRELKGVRWLAIDYLDDVHGECQKSFPWETTIPGFKAEVRSTEFITDAKGGSPSVRHQRIEYRMPDSSPRDQLERLRDDLEKKFKQKSFRLELAENQVPLTLFELPGVEGGSLKARIKVMPPLKLGGPNDSPEDRQTVANLESLLANEQSLLEKFTAEHPAVKEVRAKIEDARGKLKRLEQGATNKPDEAAENRLRLAREALAAARKKADAGQFSQYDLAQAERHFAEVAAQGDVEAAARTNLKFAQEALAVTKRRVEVGVLAPLDLKFAESRLALAEYELKEALKTNSPTAKKIQAGSTPLTGPGPNPSALQFRLVADDTDTAAPVDVMNESRRDGTSVPLRMLRTVLLDGSAVASAGIVLETNGHRTVGIELTTEGARQFGAITAANINRQLAIVSGGRVLSAPIIRTAITGGELQISGNMSAAECHKLVAELNRKPAGLEFSAAVERSLPRAPEFPPGAICLDLESGRFMTNRSFRADQRGTRDWLQRSGVELAAIGTADQIPVISAYDLAFIEAPTNAWNSLPSQEVGWNWALMRDAAKQESQLGTMPGRPDTFLFRTRENGFGLLQILYATNPSPVVNIRYKMVQAATAK